MALRLSGGRRLRSPRGDAARPTTGRVRQAVINLLAPQLQGCRWLELCGGSGVMACEALQWGASAVWLVERDRRMAAVARANLEAVATSLARSREDPAPAVAVVEQEALRFLRRGCAGQGVEPFTLIYADPPWAAGLHVPLAEAVATGGWLGPEGILVWECGRGANLQPPPGWREHRRRCYGACELVFLKQE